MQLICYKTGRVGFEPGDIIDVPDDTTAIDRTYFRVLHPAISLEEEDSASKLVRLPQRAAREAQKKTGSSAETEAPGNKEAEDNDPTATTPDVE